jgi:hypothetical protein
MATSQPTQDTGSVYNRATNASVLLRLRIGKGYSSVEYNVVSEFLTAASMKMAVFWVVAPCRLVEVY